MLARCWRSKRALSGENRNLEHTARAPPAVLLAGHLAICLGDFGVGQPAEQAAEYAACWIGGHRQVNLVEVYHEAQQVEVQRAKQEIEHAARRSHLAGRRADSCSECKRAHLPRPVDRRVQPRHSRHARGLDPSVRQRTEQRAENPTMSLPRYRQHHLVEVYVETQELEF